MIHKNKKRMLSAGLATIMLSVVMPFHTTADAATAISVSGMTSVSQKTSFANNVTLAGNVIIDADLSDWKNIPSQSSENNHISEWKAAYSKDRSMLYFAYEGTATSEWDYNYLRDNSIQIHYADDSKNNGEKIRIQFAYSDGAYIKNNYYADIDGALIQTVNEAHGNTAGPYRVEASIPASYFSEQDFTITFAGSTLSSKDISAISGEDLPKDNVEETYRGITIDGKYNDWNAVPKADASHNNSANPDCLELAAMVFDGDYVYVYIKDGQNGYAQNAGSHGNGKFAITTDTGRELLFQLKSDGSVSGVDDAICAHVGKHWEISIPASTLPAYNKTISMGLYQDEPIVKDIANLSDKGDHEGGSNSGSFSGIVYDGLYGDWSSYPHSLIDYSTAGTHEGVVDAEGALYSDGSNLFGHVTTSLPKHVKEQASALAGWTSIKFNDNNNENGVFHPYFATVDRNGNINWNPQKKGLAEGSYEFYMFSSDGWHSSKNINSLNEHDQWYGKMTVTIGDTTNECEYYLDLNKLAEKFNCDATDFKKISAHYSELGNQWLTTAGASSGAWLGIVLCCVVTGAVLLYRRKKTRRLVSE